MSDTTDFVIENGVLTEYKGKGGDVVIPGGVASIGKEAFYNCARLTRIMIPESVTGIGNYAFSGCRNLKSVTIPDSLTSIGNSAFHGCNSLTYNEYDNALYLGNAQTPFIVLVRVKDDSISSCVIHNGTKIIDSYAFSYCDMLTSVVIPDSVTSIGNSAFYGCEKLKSITIPNSVTSIEMRAFEGCSSLTSITIPNSVTSIGDWGFSGCTGLTSITISNGVTSIGKYAFLRCEKLSSVAVPNSVTSIGESAFDGCGNVTFVASDVAHEKVQKNDFVIENGVLTKYKGTGGDVVIPGGVASIGSGAFTSCKMKTLHIPASVAEIAPDAFARFDGETGEYFECENLEAFIVDPENSVFHAEDSVLFGNMKGGKALLFYPCARQGAEYTVPDDVVQIRDHAFWCVKYLRKLTVPEGVEKIAAGALRHTEIEYVNLPHTVSKLPKKALYGIDDFTNVPYVSFYYPEIADNLKKCIYIGNIDDLSGKKRSSAADGFLYALQNGITEILKYQAGYADFFRRNIGTYCQIAAKQVAVLQWFIEEKILPSKETDQLLEELSAKDFPDAVVALLAYKNEQFGSLTEDDFSISDDTHDMKTKLKIRERQEQIKDQKGISGLVFVVTGELEQFGYWDEYRGFFNRDEIKAFIEQRGGYLRGAVSGKTDYLICNDPNSDSSKCKKAAELGIPIITEEEFLSMADLSES